jgi:TonB family protein
MNPDCPRFEGLDRARRGRVAPQHISLALHGVLLAWLLHSPAPIFVKPASVTRGVPGGSVTQLYWTNQSSAMGEANTGNRSAIFSRRQRAARTPLTWNQRPKLASATDAYAPPQQVGQDTRTTASDRPSQAPPLGSPYGSLSAGFGAGSEVRPALPLYAFDPLLLPGDVVGNAEGDEVVEITIDESGNVVGMHVLQSLGPAVDAKVLAVLQNWRFRPATRDGVAIPSKQDIHYHYKPK